MFYFVIILVFFNNYIIAMNYYSLSQKIDQILKQKCINYIARNINQFKEIEQQLPQDLMPDIEKKATRNLLSQNTTPIKVTLNQKKITDQAINSITSHNNGIVAGIYQQKGMYQEVKTSSASISWWDKYGNNQELLKSCGKRYMTKVWHINDQLVAGIVNDVDSYRTNNCNDNLVFIDTNSIKNSLCKMQEHVIENLSVIDHNRCVVAGRQLKIWDIKNSYLISTVCDHYCGHYNDDDAPLCVLDENHILTSQHKNNKYGIACWDLRNNKSYDLITSAFQTTCIKKLADNTICYGQWSRSYVYNSVYRDSSNIVMGHCEDTFIQDNHKVIEKDVLCNLRVGFWASFYPRSIDLSYNNNFIIVSPAYLYKPAILLLNATTLETLIIFLYQPQNLESVCMLDDDTIAIGARDGLSTINLNKSLSIKALVENNPTDNNQALIKLWQNS